MPYAKAPHASAGPRVTLGSLYALQFAHMGIVMPFLAPWLASRGFSAPAIGVLMALPPLFNTIAPWSWGAWADRSGRRRGLLALAAAAAGAALLALAGAAPQAAIVVLVAIYGFSRAPLLPFIEATTLEQAERHGFGYGAVRLWGSLAFVAAAGGFGAALERLPLGSGLVAAGVSLLALAALAAVRLPSTTAAAAEAPQAVSDGRCPPAEASRPLPGTWRLLAVCALMQASHAAYYAYYSIHLQQLGYGGATIGGLWALAVLCEVALLARLDRLVGWLGERTVLRVALLVAAVRWLVIGSATGIPVLALGQTLHAVTYAAFHVAAIREVYRRFPAGLRTRGQSLYSGMTYGLGLFAGSLAVAWLAGRAGLEQAFLASAAVALVAVLLSGRRRARSSSTPLAS